MSEEQREWQLIYSSTNRMQATIVMQHLQDEGIEAVMIDKKDSSYTIFGESEIYCPLEQAFDALNILEKINE